MNHVLVLRALPEALELVEKLKQFHVSVVLEPLFTFHHLSLTNIDYSDVQALVVTSKHAIQVLEHFPFKFLPLYTVGDSTADKGKKVGFKTVISAGGAAKDLIQLLTKRLTNPNKKIIYFAGDIIKKDIAEVLTNQGLWAEKVTCYQAVATTRLSNDLQNQLKQNMIQTIIFLSRRQVDVFTQMMGQLNDNSWQNNIECLCLSRSIAETAKYHGWKKVSFCSKPNITSLLRCFDDIQEKKYF